MQLHIHVFAATQTSPAQVDFSSQCCLMPCCLQAEQRKQSVAVGVEDDPEESEEEITEGDIIRLDFLSEHNCQ